MDIPGADHDDHAATTQFHTHGHSTKFFNPSLW
jgi:hypothetical protein